MQKWEYMFVTAESEKDHLLPRYINGQEIPNWKEGIALYNFTNQLGEEGWELVAAPYTAIGSASSMGQIGEREYVHRLIFKRPKA